MKKPGASKKKKKRSSRKRPEGAQQNQAAVSKEEQKGSGAALERGEDGAGVERKKRPQQVSVRKEAEKKKEPDKKKERGFSPRRYVSVAVHFLREAHSELKKVKWPTRKELLASTAMVILLVLVAALFLGVIDFGLIKIMKVVVG